MSIFEINPEAKELLSSAEDLNGKIIEAAKYCPPSG